MKKIVCELCEGTKFEKVDGRFVCEGCGTSYSADEARGMMREMADEEPIATDASTVSIPQVNSNQQQLDNILLLAASSYEANNKAEAENYCNQAIVLDAMCYKAWMLKGKAVGWSSTIANNRFEEAAHSFCKAIDFAPEDEKDDIKEQAVEELRRLGLALISTRQSRFSKYPDKEELNGFTHDRNVLIDALTVLLQHGNVVGMPDGYLEEIATMMNQAAVAGFRKVRDEYNSETYPSEHDFDKYLNQSSNCAELLRKAINASDDDDDADVQRYKNLITVLEDGMEKCSYKKVYDSYGGWRYIKEYSLTDSAKDVRREEVQQCKDAITKIERETEEKKAAEERKAEEEKKARIDAYWEAHADEKSVLDSELKELNEKKDKLNKEMADIDTKIRSAEPTEKVPSEDEKEKIQDQISELNSRRSKLGIFAGKEKKRLGEEIASLEGRVFALNNKIEEEKKARKAEVDEKVAPLKTKRDGIESQYDTVVKRIAAINKELTKDPEE